MVQSGTSLARKPRHAVVVVRGVENAPLEETGSASWPIEKRTDCCQPVLPRPSTGWHRQRNRGPTVFAGFGVRQAGAQSGAVPLGAMQLSRCPDRSRLDVVTMAEEDPVPT